MGEGGKRTSRSVISCNTALRAGTIVADMEPGPRRNGYRRDSGRPNVAGFVHEMQNPNGNLPSRQPKTAKCDLERGVWAQGDVLAQLTDGTPAYAAVARWASSSSRRRRRRRGT